MSEREIVTVTNPAQLLAVTAQILGFHPVDGCTLAIVAVRDLHGPLCPTHGAVDR